VLRQLVGSVLAGVEQADSVASAAVGHDLLDNQSVLSHGDVGRAAELLADGGDQTLGRAGAELQHPRLGSRFIAEQKVREGL
jgi:hypothetical protein